MNRTRTARLAAPVVALALGAAGLVLPSATATAAPEPTTAAAKAPSPASVVSSCGPSGRLVVSTKPAAGGKVTVTAKASGLKNGVTYQGGFLAQNTKNEAVGQVLLRKATVRRGGWTMSATVPRAYAATFVSLVGDEPRCGGIVGQASQKLDVATVGENRGIGTRVTPRAGKPDRVEINAFTAKKGSRWTVRLRAGGQTRTVRTKVGASQQVAVATTLDLSGREKLRVVANGPGRQSYAFSVTRRW